MKAEIISVLTVPNLSSCLVCLQDTLFHPQESEPYIYAFNLVYITVVGTVRSHARSDSPRELKMLQLHVLILHMEKIGLTALFRCMAWIDKYTDQQTIYAQLTLFITLLLYCPTLVPLKSLKSTFFPPCVFLP